MNAIKITAIAVMQAVAIVAMMIFQVEIKRMINARIKDKMRFWIADVLTA